MSPQEAARTVLGAYNTEKTFAMVESQSKICFIVRRDATKAEVAEAVEALYGQKAVSVNTARTQYGKKAFVRLEGEDKARDLATEMGML